jgi:nicotinate-nucleotide pyrophosphorylase (carboxylating)
MFRDIVSIALKEDCAFNDITTDLTVTKKDTVSFAIRARESIIFCGKKAISETFNQLKSHKKFKNSKLKLKLIAHDGDNIAPKQLIAHGYGEAHLVLAAERVILNLIQHLSGISTITNHFIKKLNNKKITILDTRKTLPGLRNLEKYAVKVGGGKNHRFNLSDMILIKDNHIAVSGGVVQAITATQNKNKKIEIECDSIAQVTEAIKLKPDIVMLDNMNKSQIKQAITLIRKHPKIKIEVSGGINLTNISNFSSMDIDFISIGALTHSARSVDIGLDID